MRAWGPMSAPYKVASQASGTLICMFTAQVLLGALRENYGHPEVKFLHHGYGGFQKTVRVTIV